MAADHVAAGLQYVEGPVAWATPQFTSTQVNAAGKKLVSEPDETSQVYDVVGVDEALQVINNHRSSHSYPLNTFTVTLRTYARSIDSNALVAQRIKRLTSIYAKLKRFPRMKLSQMQDIGGCRAVVKSIAEVNKLAEKYRRSEIKHHLTTFDDYIAEPKVSGYRGIHIVYRYFSDKQKHKYNGLKIEIQLRSSFQHAWATAVETVGTFVQQALKSSVGEEDWLRFFTLMGTAVANIEKTAPVPDTPTTAGTLRTELRRLDQTLQVGSRLRAYGNALQTLRGGVSPLQNAHYYLLELDPEANQLKVSGYKQSELQRASDDYLESEKRVRGKPGTDAVLVSVDSLTALERAYPNYFADTRVFLQLLEVALGKRKNLVITTPATQSTTLLEGE